MRLRLGTANYSYGFFEKAFVRAFKSVGLNVSTVDMPEICKGALSYQTLFRESPENIVHVAFRSTEHQRIASGCRNICYFAWEFDVLRDRNLITEPVTGNQVHMLSLFDEIWVSSNYTKGVLNSYGLKDVYVVPSPTCGEQGQFPVRLSSEEALARLEALPCASLSCFSGLDRTRSAELVVKRQQSLKFALRGVSERRKGSGNTGDIYLTICNPHDRRKNLANLIEGFHMARCDSDDVLIVKLLVPNRGDFRANAQFDDAMIGLFGGAGALDYPQVLVITDFLSDDQMTALYSLADFYLCASHCEGFNLPLIEAMSHGTIPITTGNTAMSDYIDHENAIVISEQRFPAPVPHMAADVAGQIYDIAFASRFDIARAADRASRLDATQRAEISSRAAKTIRDKFSHASLNPIILHRLLPVVH